MYKIPLLFAFYITLSFSLSCQSNLSKMTAETNPYAEDEAKITEMIETYFEGWMTGDTTKLGRAMHQTCQLKNIKDDEVLIFDRAKYLSFFKPRPRRQNAGGRIIAIDITDDVGSAKCEIYTADRLFIDYFNLAKIKGEWYIVDKLATNKAKDSK